MRIIGFMAGHAPHGIHGLPRVSQTDYLKIRSKPSELPNLLKVRELFDTIIFPNFSKILHGLASFSHTIHTQNSLPPS